MADAGDRRARSLGVSIEAKYTVGEYDILILSAKESNGLETWLTENGYRIPAGASNVLGSYIRQNMRFFVARVNLKEQSRLGFTYLRPLQVAYESPKFMLPIRLGTVNANGPQELFIYALTRTGRVETTNYRTVRLPTGMELPAYIKDDFPRFYRAMFDQQVRRQDMRVVFLEYAWDMGWCDPCAADPLSSRELQELGRLLGRRCGAHARARGRPRPVRPSTRRRRTSSSRACTCATTAHISRRISSSRRPAIARTSRAATSCGTHGRDADTCSAADEYRRALPTRLDARRARYRRLQGGGSKRSGSGRAGRRWQDVAWWKEIWR